MNIGYTARELALGLNLRFYATGKPCKRGHISKRYASNGGCQACTSENNKRINSTPKGKQAARERDAKRKGVKPIIPTYPEPDNCECCGATPRGRYRSLMADHDHRTGQFRGWLCGKCNTGIGRLGDNIEGVSNALDYLNRSKNQGDTP